MSLINDALKRAKGSQPPPPGAPPLPPVPPPAHGGGWMLILATVVFVAAAGLLGLALMKHAAPAVHPGDAPTPTASSGMPPAPAAETTPPAVSTGPEPVLPMRSNAPVLAANPAPGAAAEPLPKVQGIIFDSIHPTAIVNGQTIGVGDSVGDLLVKQILKNSIVFQRPDGSQETLKIGQ
jgi:hypothetical protein